MDSSTLVSALGIGCALAGMAVLIFKRVTPVIIGPLAAILVCLTSKIPVTFSEISIRTPELQQK